MGIPAALFVKFTKKRQRLGDISAKTYVLKKKDLKNIIEGPMKDSKQSKKTIELAKGIKIAAIYLIVAGGVGVLWPLTGLGPHLPEFQAKSFAYKFCSYTRAYYSFIRLLAALFCFGYVFIKSRM